jgi:hypothetical protein
MKKEKGIMKNEYLPNAGRKKHRDEGDGRDGASERRSATKMQDLSVNPLG